VGLLDETMMNIHLYNKLFYLTILYGFFEYDGVHGCITYMCGACVVSAYLCQGCSYVSCVENIRILWYHEDVYMTVQRTT